MTAPLIQLTDAAGHPTNFAYDTADRLLRLVGPRGDITESSYDLAGRRIAVTDPLKLTTRYAYDAEGNPTAQIDALDHRTDTTYDALNRVIAVANPTLTDGQRPMTRVAYDAVGNTVTITTPRGFATTRTYDVNDNLLTSTDPLGAQTQYTYDLLDRPSATTDANGNTFTTTYNLLDRPLATNDGRGNTTRFAYDQVANLIERVDALGHPTNYAYDAAHRLIQQTDPLGNATLYKHDLLGRVVATADAQNQTTGYSYDALGNLLAVTDALGHPTRYEYDAARNLVGITDANNHTSVFQYDLRNQLIAESNPLGATWRNAYDAVGRLTQQVDALGHPKNLEYDSNNRLVGIQYGAPDSVQAPVVFQYDLDGNQTGMCDGLGCNQSTYDPVGRLNTTSDWLGRTINRSYDAVGNQVGMIYPNGHHVRYAFDANNQVVGVTDAHNQTSIYERNPLGNVTRLLHPNDLLATFTYDPASRLTSIDHRILAAPTPQSAYAYVLDAVGNRTQTTETRAAFDGSATNVTLNHRYTYDALNQLISAATDGPASATNYSFDAVGNRQAKAGTVLAPATGIPALPVAPRPEQTSTTYNAANQLERTSDAHGDVNMTYDANGNRIQERSRQSDDKTSVTDYTYDRENRLVGVQISVNDRLAMEAHYEYDGYGRRVRKTVSYPYTSIPTRVTTFLYDGLDSIGAQVAENGRTQESYYYLAPSPITGMRRPIEVEQLDSSKRYWFQHDGLDSIVALSDEQGHVVSAFLYDEYGQHLVGSTDLQLLTYTAQDYDAETGLLHFYARYYDPAHGVWLTQDPYRGELMVPGTLGRYGYVGGNPVNYVDHYGWLSCTINEKETKSYTDCYKSQKYFDVNITTRSRTCDPRRPRRAQRIGHADPLVGGFGRKSVPYAGVPVAQAAQLAPLVQPFRVLRVLRGSTSRCNTMRQRTMFQVWTRWFVLFSPFVNLLQPTLQVEAKSVTPTTSRSLTHAQRQTDGFIQPILPVPASLPKNPPYGLPASAQPQMVASLHTILLNQAAPPTHATCGNPRYERFGGVDADPDPNYCATRSCAALCYLPSRCTA